ncbi:hypothetical protein BDR03DRAFT_982709 [Suillus americanus]|nr:hypothetical protein BDR03DRAFT_982709 [Suillus americanus]
MVESRSRGLGAHAPLRSDTLAIRMLVVGTKSLAVYSQMNPPPFAPAHTHSRKLTSTTTGIAPVIFWLCADGWMSTPAASRTLGAMTGPAYLSGSTSQCSIARDDAQTGYKGQRMFDKKGNKTSSGAEPNSARKPQKCDRRNSTDSRRRIKNDFDYAVALAGVPEARLSSFRTNLKKLAHQIVVSRFALKKGCADQVEDLIKSHKYIFPVDAKGKVLGDQPFCDESIIDTIHLSFFDGENSIGVQSRDDFVSVLDGNDEPELPVAMIYAILKDWSSGNPPLSAQVKSFNSSFHIGVYKAHQATLTRIFNSSQKKYHALMARLYKAVSTVESSESAPTGSSDTCDYLDLDAMGED